MPPTDDQNKGNLIFHRLQSLEEQVKGIREDRHDLVEKLHSLIAQLAAVKDELNRHRTDCTVKDGQRTGMTWQAVLSMIGAGTALLIALAKRTQ